MTKKDDYNSLNQIFSTKVNGIDDKVDNITSEIQYIKSKIDNLPSFETIKAIEQKVNMNWDNHNKRLDDLEQGRNWMIGIVLSTIIIALLNIILI